nr:hypothetical protein [Paenibacillus dendrobii]
MGEYRSWNLSQHYLLHFRHDLLKLLGEHLVLLQKRLQLDSRRC